MAADIEEYPFSFINTPSSLQSLSLTEVALALWRYKYRTNSSFPSIWPSTFLQDKFWSCREIITVPSPIVAKIDEMIFSLGAKLRDWFELYVKLYHCDRNFAETFRIFFEHIVIDFFGNISFEGTATNIINLAKLSDVENYKIACTFCLEDQVRKFWPSVAKDIEFDVKSRYDENDWNLIFYWNSSLKSGGDDSHNRTVQMNTAACRDRNWSAFEYFWKTLSKRKRVSQVILFLKEGYDQAAIRSLPTLNQIQAAKVFEDTAAEILRILIPKDEYFQHADRLAALVGHEVLKKESCFFDVLFVLWKMVFNPHVELDLNYAKCDQINELMLKIWSKARVSLKAYVWNNRVLDFVKELSDNSMGTSKFSCYYGHNMEFMLELLRNSQSVNKELLWRNNWRRLALRAKPEYLKQFVEVCLPNDDDEAIVETFKEQMTRFGDLFTSLVYSGFYSDLRDHLNFCSKNDDDFRLLSRRTLKSHSVFVILQSDDNKLAEFNRFVDEIFSKVRDDVDEFKEQLISSSGSLLTLHDALILNGLIDFHRIIGRFVTSEVRLKRLRCKMLDHMRNYLVGYLSAEPVFYADQWQMLLEWCTRGEEEEILEFRRSLNVNEIFLKHLAYYRDYVFEQHCTTRNGKLILLNGYSCLSFFEGFLKWYFKNDEDRVKFKLHTINNYEQIDDICKMMEGDTSWARTKMYYLLDWFFDNDVDKMREFCEKCGEFFEMST